VFFHSTTPFWGGVYRLENWSSRPKSWQKVSKQEFLNSEPLSLRIARLSSLFLWFLNLDRGGVPDLSVSGDKSDLVVVDPRDPTTTSKTRSANAIVEPTPHGYRPCWRKISLITKINSCAQSKNEQ
jgi:hypothetical protein